jgi:hypothetical protein
MALPTRHPAHNSTASSGKTVDVDRAGRAYIALRFLIPLTAFTGTLAVFFCGALKPDTDAVVALRQVQHLRRTVLSFCVVNCGSHRRTSGRALLPKPCDMLLVRFVAMRQRP